MGCTKAPVTPFCLCWLSSNKVFVLKPEARERTIFTAPLLDKSLDTIISWFSSTVQFIIVGRSVLFPKSGSMVTVFCSKSIKRHEPTPEAVIYKWSKLDFGSKENQVAPLIHPQSSKEPSCSYASFSFWNRWPANLDTSHCFTYVNFSSASA